MASSSDDDEREDVPSLMLTVPNDRHSATARTPIGIPRLTPQALASVERLATPRGGAKRLPSPTANSVSHSNAGGFDMFAAAVSPRHQMTFAVSGRPTPLQPKGFFRVHTEPAPPAVPPLSEGFTTPTTPRVSPAAVGGAGSSRRASGLNAMPGTPGGTSTHVAGLTEPTPCW
jgi:hypothetical protein